MKKFLLNITSFGLILVAVFSALNFLQSHYNKKPIHYSKKYEELYTNKVNANSIILGSSHAVHSVQPSLLDTDDHKWFNYAYNGAGPKFYLKWYEQIFQKEYPKPKVCVYAIDWFIFDPGWLYRRFEHDSEYFSFSTFTRLLPDKDFDRKTLIDNRFPFIKYKNDIYSSLQLKKGGINYLEQHYSKGFIPFALPYKEENFSIKRDITVYHPVVEIFKKLIKKLDDDNIEIVFIVTPEFNLESSFYNSESFQLIDELVQEYNIPLLNFNTDYKMEAINDDITNFIDWGHMSLKGSTEFSELLNLELEKLFKK